MKQSQTKKVYIYPIKDTDGTPLDLINVLTHVSPNDVSPDEARVEKKLDRVDTFIGRNDRGEYVKVGGTENLSAPWSDLPIRILCERAGGVARVLPSILS